MGDKRARHVEEHASVRPFLEPRKARDEYGYAPKHLPEPNDRQKVDRVPKDRVRLEGSRLLRQLSISTSNHQKREAYGSRPIRNHLYAGFRRMTFYLAECLLIPVHGFVGSAHRFLHVFISLLLSKVDLSLL